MLLHTFFPILLFPIISAHSFHPAFAFSEVLHTHSFHSAFVFSELLLHTLSTLLEFADYLLWFSNSIFSYYFFNALLFSLRGSSFHAIYYFLLLTRCSVLTVLYRLHFCSKIYLPFLLLSTFTPTCFCLATRSSKIVRSIGKRRKFKIFTIASPFSFLSIPAIRSILFHSTTFKFVGFHALLR